MALSSTRRSILIGILAMLLPASAANAPPTRTPIDPLAALTPTPPAPLAERLRTFARLVAEHRWGSLIEYFDPEHLSFQHKIWFSPEYNKHPTDPADPKAQAAFREGYLIGVLGLAMVDNHVERLNDIEQLRYLLFEEPFGGDGPLKVRMEVLARGGRTLSGWFFVDRASLLFFGSAG